MNKCFLVLLFIPALVVAAIAGMKITPSDGTIDIGTNATMMGNLGIGTLTPGLINGAAYPGKVIHIGDSVQSSICLDTTNGYSSVVFNDGAAATNSKLYELHVHGGGGVFELVSGTDDGMELNKIFVCNSSNTVSFPTASQTTFGTASGSGIAHYIYGVHTANRGVLYVEGADFGYIGVNGPSSAGSGYLINHNNVNDFLLYSPASTRDFAILEKSTTERLRIKETTGNVGIGTNAPSEKLEVLGNAKLTGSLLLGTNILSFTGSDLYWNGVKVNP